ncbi:MAG: BatA domain-containing protein [Gemmatimonadales bacterium]
MSFVNPGFLVAAFALSALIVGLHFIVTTDPKTAPLPTARFAPERPVRETSRALRFNDVLLLLVRVALILVVGAALAGPVLPPRHRALVRILVVDRSSSVADASEVADSARGMHEWGDALVLFDSSVTVIREGASDSLATLRRSTRRGRLTPALVAAIRLASEMQENADSLELTVISPVTNREMDAATDSVRALWPGAIRLVPVSAMTDTVPQQSSLLPDAADDPLRFALPPSRGPASVRIVRATPSAADTAWARASGHVLVEWPRGRTRAGDTVGAVTAGDVVVVAPFVRYARLTGAAPTLLRSNAPAPYRVVARWVDGSPAAIESDIGAGCIRTVAVEVPATGDLVLQPRFAKLVAALTGPCGGAEPSALASRAQLAALAGAGRGWAAGGAFPAPEALRVPLAPWLLAAALALAAGEMVMRRRTAGATAA